MTDLESLRSQVRTWLEPLGGDEGPCGPDLEYDNAFLELTKAAEGKPPSQFDERGTPPDWRAVRGQAEELFERTRDLRIALLWLRASIGLEGAPALVPGLELAIGLLQRHWDTVHPAPDPSDNDPYARANALALLPSMEGVLGDLLSAPLVALKGIGEIRLRDVEVALGNLSSREGEPSYTREHLERMFMGAEAEGAGARDVLTQMQQQLAELGTLLDERFGSGSRGDLKPLVDLIAHAMALMPEPAAESGESADGSDAQDQGGAAGGGSRGALSGAVNSRADAVRAIELVCAYLERHEPTNPAQLFLRRASALLERNFLELLKELAPNALDDVARMVGVDPTSVAGGGWGGSESSSSSSE